MKHTLITYSFTLLAGIPSVLLSAKGDTAAQKNVLIIMTDEHNLRTLGCYRDLMTKDQAEIWGEGNVVETPHLDALAAKGVIALSSYASSPVSGPSRASFQTGYYAHNTAVSTNDIPMKQELETFADVLSNNNYSTSYIGKWHLSGDGRPQWAPSFKFGWQDNRYMFNRGHWKNLQKTETGARVGAVSPKNIPSYAVNNADEKSFATDFLFDRAMEFIQANKHTKFCCMVSVPDPHGPNTVRKPYDTMYNHMDFKKPYTYNERGDHTNDGWAKAEGSFSSKQMQQYFGMVKCIDDNLGEMVQFLKTEGLFENTLIIFTSDHGDLCGEHHRHNKAVPFEMSARVPFVMHCPELIEEKLVNRTSFSTVDFKPTLLGLLGIKEQKQSEGKNLSAHLLGKPIAKKKNVTFVRSTTPANGFEGGKISPKWTPWIAAITPRYKLIHTATGNKVPWFIDLEKDPNELYNKYNDPTYAKVIKQLSKQLIQYGKTAQDPTVLQPKVQKELAERL